MPFIDVNIPAMLLSGSSMCNNIMHDQLPMYLLACKVQTVVITNVIMLLL